MPVRGILFANPASGADRSDDPVAELRRRCPGLEEAHTDPAGLDERVAAAVGRGVDFVAVAGGDGTVRSVAEHLVGTGVPLLVVPAGTRNHFAKAVGTPTVEAVVAAIEDGRVTPVDVGDVNGRIFLNNAGLGAYPRLVRRRARREGDLSKRTAGVLATIEELRHGHPILTSVDGDRPTPAWLVFVGNGRYGSSVFDLGSRTALDEGILDLALVAGHGRWSRARAARAILTGGVKEHELVERRSVTEATVRVRPAGRVDVALDGEVLHLATPLRFSTRPGVLDVLVPADT